jgi:hypothetical protein
MTHERKGRKCFIMNKKIKSYIDFDVI